MIINNTSERYKNIFEDYKLTGNMEETGKKFGITRQRVQQIVKTFDYKKPFKYIPSKEEKDAIKAVRKINLFWSRIDKKSSDECWEWRERKINGYGTTTRMLDNQYTHRIAWILTYGEIPEGLYVLHKCDNPPCCNPNHLYLGTMKDNAKDRQERFYKNGKIPIYKKDRT